MGWHPKNLRTRPSATWRPVADEGGVKLEQHQPTSVAAAGRPGALPVVGRYTVLGEFGAMPNRNGM
jgi:hypothetical protein